MKLGSHVGMSAPDMYEGSVKEGIKLWRECVHGLYRCTSKHH